MKQARAQGKKELAKVKKQIMAKESTLTNLSRRINLQDAARELAKSLSRRNGFDAALVKAQKRGQEVGVYKSTSSRRNARVLADTVLHKKPSGSTSSTGKRVVDKKRPLV
jgi:hypothetical protein